MIMTTVLVVYLKINHRRGFVKWRCSGGPGRPAHRLRVERLFQRISALSRGGFFARREAKSQIKRVIHRVVHIIHRYISTEKVEKWINLSAFGYKCIEMILSACRTLGGKGRAMTRTPGFAARRLKS